MFAVSYLLYIILGYCSTEPCLDEVGNTSSILYYLFFIGVLSTISVIGMALSVQQYRDSRDPRKSIFLECAFYNTDTNVLTLVFGKPAPLSDRWSLTLVDDARLSRDKDGQQDRKRPNVHRERWTQ